MDVAKNYMTLRSVCEEDAEDGVMEADEKGIFDSFLLLYLLPLLRFYSLV